MKLSAPVVTEEDILRGSKSVHVPLRNGKSAEVQVSSMPWRLALESSAGRAQSTDIITGCIADPPTLPAGTLRGEWMSTRDNFLNAVSPRGLAWLTSVAVQLTLGLDRPDQSEKPDPADQKKTDSPPTSSPSAT